MTYFRHFYGYHNFDALYLRIRLCDFSRGFTERVTFIYTDAPDINMLTNVFFLVVCILLNQIPAPQMNPDDFCNALGEVRTHTHTIMASTFLSSDFLP